MAKFGLKEVLNVVFIDRKTNKPAIFFDTLKVSNIENTSESTTATGGQGNATLKSWSYGRTATMTITDALLSMKSLAMLAGTSVSTGVRKVYEREFLTGITTKADLRETPVANSVTVFKVIDGEAEDEVTAFTVSGKTLTFTTALPAGTDIAVYYDYELAEAKSRTVEFSGSKFPSAYKVIGWGIVNGKDGNERVQLVIPNAQLKTDHTLTFDAENVSTFDFNLDVIADGEGKQLYEFIHYT